MDPFSIGLSILSGLFIADALIPSKKKTPKYTGPIPKQIGNVPFAKPTGKIWPVFNGPEEVSYLQPDNIFHGNGATAFGSFRADTGSGERIHAGIDLSAGPSNKILSMEDGIILGNISGYVKLDTTVVQHESCIAVYAEIAIGSLTKAGLKKSSKVKAGQVIGFGSLNYDNNSMLHLELWSLGHAPKFFTPWYRGKPAPIGLLNPTEYLLQLARS